jgi:hypothetical protein
MLNTLCKYFPLDNKNKSSLIITKHQIKLLSQNNLLIQNNKESHEKYF